jgi:hypothetical protein
MPGRLGDAFETGADMIKYVLTCTFIHKDKGRGKKHVLPIYKFSNGTFRVLQLRDRS